MIFRVTLKNGSWLIRALAQFIIFLANMYANLCKSLVWVHMLTHFIALSNTFDESDPIINSATRGTLFADN